MSNGTRANAGGTVDADNPWPGLAAFREADQQYFQGRDPVIDELEHMPSTGEKVEALGWCFEVVDLDGRRIDKVLARPSSEETTRVVGAAG